MIQILKGSEAYKLLFFLSFLTSIVSFGQDLPPRPSVCDNPPPGYKIDGSFLVPTSVCTKGIEGEEQTGDVSVFTNAGALIAVSYYYNFKDGVDFTNENDPNHVKAALVGGMFQATKKMPPGEFWIIQIAEDAGQKKIVCRSIEVYNKSKPELNIFSCDGNTVKVEIPASAANRHDKYKIDWGNGEGIEEVNINESDPLPFSQTKSYTGTLNQVSVTGVYVLNGKEVCETNPYVKNPSSGQVPVITSLSFANGGASAEVKYTGFTTGKEYEMEYAEDNGTSPVWKFLEKTSDGDFKVSTLNPQKKYCFRLKATTECNDDYLYSNTVCSIGISSSLASSSDVTVNWEFPASPSGNPTELRLERVTESCLSCPPTILNLNNNAQTSYKDQNIVCTEKYGYQIVAKYSVFINGEMKQVTIASHQLEVDPMGVSVSIVPNGIINAGYRINDESTVRLIVHTDSDVSEYQFQSKAPGEGSFGSIGSSKNESFDDISVKPSAGSYCYKYSIEDACGIKSKLSPEFCTVFLQYEGTILKWTAYSLPANVSLSGETRYKIERYESGIGTYLPVEWTDELDFGAAIILSQSNDAQVKFRILAEQDVTIPGYGSYTLESYSNAVMVPVPADVFVPSAFSPNGDGINETFKINSKFVENASIVIFDRWGGIVFEGIVGGRAWDGTDASGLRKLPAGSYTYRINGLSEAGVDFLKTGTITLLR
jgi:gliding motility-associated-like protein